MAKKSQRSAIKDIMLKSAVIFFSNTIGLAIGAAFSFAGIFHIFQPQTVFEKIDSSNMLVPIINNDWKQEQSANTTNEQKSGTVDAQNKKTEEQAQINKLEKLVKEAGFLTEQFSALVEQQKNKVLVPTLIPASDLNQKIRPAIVNIFCTTKTEGALHPITGSGVVVSEEGIVLTNAHIGQYFLLKNYQTENFISCVARQRDGDVTFSLDLVYLSPTWVKLHAIDISKQNPTGTGQFDYALLSMKKDQAGVNGNSQMFPFLQIETVEKQLIGGSGAVLLAGYPAEFLSELSLEKDLSLVSSIGEIQSVFTFSETTPTVDLFGVDGSIVSQKGSSGGAVVSQETGKLIGMITTSTTGKTTGERELRAISTTYIARAFKEETNMELEDILNGKIEEFKKAFEDQMTPSLVKQLETELDK